MLEKWVQIWFRNWGTTEVSGPKKKQRVKQEKERHFWSQDSMTVREYGIL